MNVFTQNVKPAKTRPRAGPDRTGRRSQGPALTLPLPPIRMFVMAMDELIREGLFGSPAAA